METTRLIFEKKALKVNLPLSSSVNSSGFSLS